MALTAEMNMMIAQLAGYTTANSQYSSNVSLNREQTNGFSSIGLSPKNLKEHYSELDIAKWNQLGLHLGQDLNALPEIVFKKTPSKEVLSYIQSRKRTIDELINAIEFTKKSPTEGEGLTLLQGFLNMTSKTRTEALKNNSKGLVNTTDSIHLIELEKAARKAASKDESFASVLARNPKAYLYEPALLDATLEELKKRQGKLGELESSYNGNATQHGLIGHVADFFRAEWLPLAFFGLNFRKVDALEVDTLGKWRPIKDHIINTKGVSLPNGSEFKYSTKHKEWRILTGKTGANGKKLTEALPEGLEVVTKKRLAIHQTALNTGRRAKTAWNALTWKNFKALGSKVPGGKAGLVAMGAALIWAVAEGACYMAKNPDWAKPITQTYTSLTENYSNPIFIAADYFVPDLGKAVGRPIWTSESLNNLKREFKSL